MEVDAADSERIDSLTAALSAFGFPIYVALLFAGSIQRACHRLRPWLISVSLCRFAVYRKSVTTEERLS
jgi:hypothetical protein